MRTAIVSLIALAGLATAANAQPAPEAAPAAPAPEAAAAEPAPAAEEKTYVLPTTGAEGQIIDVINRVCKPLVKGGNFDQLAGSLGYKKNKREGTYVGTLVEKPYTLTINPQGSNKDVCRLTLSYAIDGEKPIIVGLNIFSYLHKPELLQQRNDFVPATDYKRITNSWEYFTDHESIGLVFLQLKKPDGTPAGKNADLGEVLYSERTF
ncbi:hypothetical protein [Phenylobacterium sp.]|uniref:hypothetical protein n=1 Tax=Phenylobacterium sp. TaxID=1871053 RepID=UPI00289A7103|nr:hypothetical protein [Phenylobacterium sp.]